MVASATIGSALVAFAFIGVSAQAQQATALDPAIEHLNSCVGVEGAHLLLLALIDESSSLRQRDPDSARVEGLRAALGALARPTSVRTEVLLAGFSTDFAALGGWRPLNATTLPEVKQAATGFTARNNGPETDFRTALEGARTAFSTREAELRQNGVTATCRLLLLFTDGEFYVDPDGPKSLPAGRDELCRRDGIVDQLRAADTVIVAIVLAGSAGGTPPPDQDFLKSIAEGRANELSCGQRTKPPGRHLPVEGFDALVAAFDRISPGGTSVPGEPIRPCTVGAAAQDCTRTFELDRSLSEFHILANVGDPAVEVELTSPGVPQPLRLKAGADQRTTMGTAVLDVVAAGPRSLIIDGSLPPAATDWVGTWKVRFIDTTGTHANSATQSQITVFGGLVPVVDPVPSLVAGETTSFEIAVTDVSGSPATPAEFVQRATVGASVVFQDGTTTPLSVPVAGADGRYRVSYPVPLETKVQPADLRLTLDVVTQGGLSLRQRVKSYPLQVQPPKGYPTVLPAELVLSSIVDSGLARGTIVFTGSPVGAGCVWFAGAQVNGPVEAGKVTVRYEPAAVDQPTCLRVDPNTPVEVAVLAEPATVRDGFAEGTITVQMTGSGSAGIRDAVLPVRFEMERSPNEPVRLLLLVLLLVVGIGLPLAALWLVKWFNARFPAPSQLRRAVVPVVVTASGVESTNTGQGLDLRAEKFTAMPNSVPDGPHRRFVDDGGAVTGSTDGWALGARPELEFRTNPGLLPSRLPFATVSAPGCRVITSSTSIGDAAEELRGEVPFSLNETWVFVVDRVVPDERAPGAAKAAAVKGTLYFYVTPGEVEPKVRRVIGEARTNLPGLAMRLRPDPVTAEQVTAGASNPPPDQPAGPSDLDGPPAPRKPWE